MTRLSPALAGGAASVTGGNLTWVVVVAVVALLALAVAGWLVREVLAAGQGTAKMQEIALAVQEGAAAYLRRSPNPGEVAYRSLMPNSSLSVWCEFRWDLRRGEYSTPLF